MWNAKKNNTAAQVRTPHFCGVIIRMKVRSGMQRKAV